MDRSIVQQAEAWHSVFQLLLRLDAKRFDYHLSRNTGEGAALAMIKEFFNLSRPPKYDSRVRLRNLREDIHSLQGQISAMSGVLKELQLEAEINERNRKVP